MIKKIITDNKYFYYPYLCLLCCSIIVLSFKEKGFATIMINDGHSLFFDYFFKYYTYVGTGFLFVPLAVFLLFYKRILGYFFLFIYAANGVVVVALKRYIISDNYRPFWVLKRMFHQVEGVEIKKLFSMPSGHTNVAFLMFLGLCFLTKNKWLHLLYLLSATLVAISRMYLYQHFLIDTVVGSVVGVVLTTAVYMFFLNKKWIG